MKRYNLVRYSIPGADLHESPDGDICMYADAQAEIDKLDELTDRQSMHISDLAHENSSLKQQLATACILANTSAEQAHHFAVALIDARGAAVGYWSNKPVEEAAQSWIDAQKPGVET